MKDVCAEFQNYVDSPRQAEFSADNFPKTFALKAQVEKLEADHGDDIMLGSMMGDEPSQVLNELDCDIHELLNEFSDYVDGVTSEIAATHNG